ncbi:MAG TPA: archaeal proteasome endopeptidase complex subunit beta [Candidatus Woesearchaeota archaeon]|nr:archaeal proteasome endopeptidase complex subunit beta [Candidatus Woesearchaeota archaeon]
MDQKEKMLHGTTTLGIVTSEGIVLAADKRASMGYLFAHAVEKVIPITDFIAMTTAGGVGDAQMIVKYMKAELKLYELRKHKAPAVKAASALLSNILFGNRMSIFPFYVQLLLAGRDESGYHLFSLAPDGSNIEDKYVSTGSGSVMAYGVLEDNFKEGMSLKEGVFLAARAIRAAIKRDVFSGNGIDLFTITENGFQKVSDAEVQKIISQ